MALPVGHPFGPPTSRAPAPPTGPVYPRDPMQESIDRIRSMQQAPAQPQPQFTPEDVLQATGDLTQGIEQEAASRQAAAAAVAAQQQAEAEAKQRAEHQQRMSGRWGQIFEHTPGQDWWDTSLRRGERIKDERQAANQQAWMNQQINEHELPPIAGLDSDPVVSADPAYSVDQTDAVTRMQQQAVNQMTAPTGKGSDVTVRPMPESSSGPMIPPSPRRQQAAEKRGRANQTWTDPASAPLPGEETLPPAVAEWNQARASSGSGGGIEALRMAYDIAEKNVPSGKTFDEWVSAQMDAHGVDSKSHPMEAQAVLEKIVSQNLHEYGHDPMGEGIKHDPRIDRRDDTVLNNRRGLADGTPMDLMTPEQRARIGSHHDGVPRTARGGYSVWDETEGQSGGFVPRGFDPKTVAAAQASGDIRQEAAAYGIDHMAYGDNTAQLEADVAKVRKRNAELGKKYDTVAVPGGGFRLAPNAYTQKLRDDQRAKQFGNDMARRWAHEMKETGLASQDVLAAYREHLASNPGDYAGATRFVENRYLNSLRMKQTQDRTLAVRQRNMQDARATRYGVNPGLVSFFDSLNSAETPEQRQALLMFAHGAQPHMGWNSLAAMYAKGQFDEESLKAWTSQMAAKPNANEQIGSAVNDFVNSPAGMATWAQVNHHISSMPGGDKMSPELKRGEARRYAMPIVQNAIQSGNYNTPDKIAFIRAVTEDAPGKPAAPDTFAAVTGVPRTDPRFAPLYQHVFGVAPANTAWENTLAGAGWLWNTATGGGQGLNPSAHAGQPNDPAL